MKTLVISAWLIVTILILGSFSGFFDATPEFSDLHKSKVVLYATSWCPYCEKMRSFFRENNIPYIEYDIEESKEGRRQFDALNGKGIPLTIVKGKVIRGFNTEAVLTAFKKRV